MVWRRRQQVREEVTGKLVPVKFELKAAWKSTVPNGWLNHALPECAARSPAGGNRKIGRHRTDGTQTMKQDMNRADISWSDLPVLRADRRQQKGLSALCVSCRGNDLTDLRVADNLPNISHCNVSSYLDKYSSAFAERPRCRVGYSYGQKWKTGTGIQYLRTL